MTSVDSNRRSYLARTAQWIATLAAIASCAAVLALRPQSGALAQPVAMEEIRESIARVSERLERLEAQAAATQWSDAETADADTVPGEYTAEEPRSPRGSEATLLSSDEIELAKRALGMTGSKRDALKSLIRSNPDAAIATVRGVVSSAAVDPSLEQIASAAIDVLAEAPGSAVDAELRGYYRTSSGPVKRAAVRALANRGDPAPLKEWIGQVRPSLRSPSVSIRARSVQALGSIRNATIVPEVLPLLRDESSEVRISAIGALARSGNEATIPAIEPLFGDAVPAVRDVAVRAVVYLRQQAAPPTTTKR